MPQAQIRSWGSADIDRVLWGRFMMDAEIRSVDAGPVALEFVDDVRGLGQRWDVSVPLGVGSVEATIEALFADRSAAVFAGADQTPRTLSVIRKQTDADVVSYPNLYRPPATVKFDRDGLVMGSVSFVGGGQGELLGRLLVNGDIDGGGWRAPTLIRVPGNRTQSAMVATAWVTKRTLSVSVSIGALTFAPHIDKLHLAILGGATVGAVPVQRYRLDDWVQASDRHDELDGITDAFMCVGVEWDGDSWAVDSDAVSGAAMITVDGNDLVVDEYIRIGTQTGARHRVTNVNVLATTQVLTLDPVLAANVTAGDTIVADPTNCRATDVAVIVHRERKED